MEFSLIRFGELNKEGRVGFGATQEGKICLYVGEKEALEKINYDDAETGEEKTSAVVHWMIYDPMVYTFEFDDERQFSEMIAARLRYPNGDFRVSRLNSVAGSIRIVLWPDGLDVFPEARKVYKDIVTNPIGL